LQSFSEKLLGGKIHLLEQCHEILKSDYHIHNKDHNKDHNNDHAKDHNKDTKKDHKDQREAALLKIS
jgi:hypothetical protein